LHKRFGSSQGVQSWGGLKVCNGCLQDFGFAPSIGLAEETWNTVGHMTYWVLKTQTYM
jgi:hypothetical protein